MNRRRMLHAACGLALTPLTGCDWFNGSDAWKEEVLLSDGRKIVVAVKVEYQTISEIGGPSARVRQRTTLHVLPGQGVAETEWSEDLAAVLLDIDPASEELVLVATITLCEQWEQWGRPRPAYIEFRLRDGVWRRQLPFSESLYERPVNLLQNWSAQTRGDYVTVEQKRGLDSGMGMADRFKRVVRNYGTSC